MLLDELQCAVTTLNLLKTFKYENYLERSIRGVIHELTFLWIILKNGQTKFKNLVLL